MIRIINWFHSIQISRKMIKDAKLVEDGFSWAMAQYYLKGKSLEEIEQDYDYIQKDKTGDYYENYFYENPFGFGVTTATNTIWLETGHKTGSYRENMK